MKRSAYARKLRLIRRGFVSTAELLHVENAMSYLFQTGLMNFVCPANPDASSGYKKTRPKDKL